MTTSLALALENTPPLTGFSCPRAAPGHERRARLDEAVRTRVRAHIEHFCDRFGAAVAQASEGLIDILLDWSSTEIDASNARGTYLGHLEGCFLHPSTDPVRAAAMAAFHIHSTGFHGAWRAKLREPARLRWSLDLTPWAQSISVDPERVVLDRHEFRPNGSLRLPALRMSRQRVAINMPWAYDLLPRLPPQDLSPLPGKEIELALARAFDFLSKGSPDSLDWIDAVITDLLPIEMEPPAYKSSTFSEALHVIAVSFPGNAPAIGELLVHESSHQYYYLAEAFGPLHDGSDTGKYWSPARKTERPIERILLAYHAFANIMLYYFDCADVGLDVDGYIARNITRWLGEIRVLQEPLEKTRALTANGRALWEPLADRLAERSRNRR